MPGEGLGREFAPEESQLGVVAREIVAEPEMFSHGGMERGDAFAGEERMEGGDVGESDEPFSEAGVGEAVELFKQMHGAVAAARADDGADGVVEQGVAEIDYAIFGRRAVGAGFAAGVGSYHRDEALAGHGPGAGIDERRVDFRRRRDNGDLIASGKSVGQHKGRI